MASKICELHEDDSYSNLVGKVLNQEQNLDFSKMMNGLFLSKYAMNSEYHIMKKYNF